MELINGELQDWFDRVIRFDRHAFRQSFDRDGILEFHQ